MYCGGGEKFDCVLVMDREAGSTSAAACEGIYPCVFSLNGRGGESYLGDPLIKLLAAFFEAKGLAAIKEEDRAETWYADWLEYQKRHGIYARLISPKEFTSLGGELDLFRLTRFLEVFGYFSAAHGYSLQVSFLGLFPILMGVNVGLKREAVGLLEKGGLFAFGVSEQAHGADLLGNEFTVTATEEGRLTAGGAKYYIGNSNCAEMISILAKRVDQPVKGRVRRAPFVLFVLRPGSCAGFRNNRKIRTLGVRSAFVGGFEVADHLVAEGDIYARGREAWDAVFGTVTLGKFFLGFGSIGICEHALEEAVAHLQGRVLYGKSVIEMPHIRLAAAQAYARLTAMKLFAYRALDYVQSANENDRRYLLFLAVQKAKVSTEGVKVVAQLSECIGAKGFEADTFFEMALRDVQLIPGLEGSTHINLAFAAQFMARYFAKTGETNADSPGSLFAGEVTPGENGYLVKARAGATHSVLFGPFLEAYQAFDRVANVRCFVKQANVFAQFVQKGDEAAMAAGTETQMAVGQAFATIVYGQLVAENAARLKVPEKIVSAIFHLLVTDLSACAVNLAGMARLGESRRKLVRRMVRIARASAADWEFVAGRVGGSAPFASR